MKKKSIVIVLAVALLLVLVLAGTAYGAPVPAPTTTGITTGIVLFGQTNNGGGSVSQDWYSWFIIQGINGKPDKGSITNTVLTIGPGGKIISKTTDTQPVTGVIKVSPTTMTFDVPGWNNWLKVVDGGWPGVKMDAWYESPNGTTWYPVAFLAGEIIVY